MLMSDEAWRAVKESPSNTGKEYIWREAHQRNQTNGRSSYFRRYFGFLQQRKVDASQGVNADETNQNIRHQDSARAMPGGCEPEVAVADV